MCGSIDIQSPTTEIRRGKKETRNVGQCPTWWPPSIQCHKVWLPTAGVPCSNPAKTQNPLKFARVPQTHQQFSAVIGPKFTILWGHVEEVLVFNKFFPDCRYMPQLQRHSPTKLYDGAEMAIFCVLYF